MSARRGRRGRADSGRRVGVSETTHGAQLLETALGLHQAGQVERAAGLYERVIAQDPEQADAMHFLGLARFQLGDAPRAAELIRRAIEKRPQAAPYHDNLGTVLEARGELEGALAAFREAARLEGETPDRSFNTGIVLEKLGRREEAEAAYRRAIELRPADGEFHYNLANLLKGSGRLDEAVAAYREAARRRPEAPEVWNNLGNALRLLGRADEALEAYRAAAERGPREAPALVNLGATLRARGELEEASDCFRRALALDASSLAAHLGLAGAQRALGRFEAALDAYRGALRVSPESADARVGFAAMARFVLPDAYVPELAECIALCMDAPEVQPQDLAAAAASQLRHRHRLDVSAPEGDAAVELLATDPLALRLLARTINVDARLEPHLVAARRRLLLEPESRWRASRGHRELAVALAMQCYANEYLYPSTPEEEAAAAALAGALASIDEAGSPEPDLGRAFTLAAMYSPPCELAAARVLAGVERRAWDAAVWPLVERALLEPLEEAALAPGIASLGGVEDATSLAVRAQYEESPYPRWLGLPARRAEGYREYLARRFAHFSPPSFLDGEARVLVAGCGTGQEAAAIATARPDCRVLGLDLSRRSLAYALRMARKLGIGNLELVQGDLLDAARLERRFHVVECTGVLHHMADPIAGWRALVDRLEPAGVMKVGLYSERARGQVALARREIAERGLSPEPRGIRAFRARLLAAGPGDALAGLCESEDLYTMSACRDLLFHVQEHCFTLPGIAAALDELGLALIGLDPVAPDVAPRYRAFNPDDETMTDLDAWERFEAAHPDAFAALYVLWCQKR